MVTGPEGGKARRPAAASLLIKIIGGAPDGQCPSKAPSASGLWYHAEPIGQVTTTPSTPGSAISNTVADGGTSAARQSSRTSTFDRSAGVPSRHPSLMSSSGAVSPPGGVPGTPPKLTAR